MMSERQAIRLIRRRVRRIKRSFPERCHRDRTGGLNGTYITVAPGSVVWVADWLHGYGPIALPDVARCLKIVSLRMGIRQ